MCIRSQQKILIFCENYLRPRKPFIDAVLEQLLFRICNPIADHHVEVYEALDQLALRHTRRIF
jgi:hypothetical protein